MVTGWAAHTALSHIRFSLQAALQYGTYVTIQPRLLHCVLLHKLHLNYLRFQTVWKQTPEGPHFGVWAFLPAFLLVFSLLHLHLFDIQEHLWPLGISFNVFLAHVLLGEAYSATVGPFSFPLLTMLGDTPSQGVLSACGALQHRGPSGAEHIVRSKKQPAWIDRHILKNASLQLPSHLSEERDL